MHTKSPPLPHPPQPSPATNSPDTFITTARGLDLQALPVRLSIPTSQPLTFQESKPSLFIQPRHAPSAAANPPKTPADLKKPHKPDCGQQCASHEHDNVTLPAFLNFPPSPTLPNSCTIDP
jgi:hypothetical protein